MKTLAALLLLALSLPANGIGLEAGINHSTYDSTRLKNDNVSAQIRVTHGNFYVWGGYDNPDVRLVGQRMGDIELVSYGLGVRARHGRFTPFLELGRFEPDASTVRGIQDEAVVTELNNIHGWRGNRHFENTEYNLNAVYGGRVGTMWEAANHVHVSVAYQFVQLEEQLQAYTGVCNWPPTKKCKSWWVDNRTLDLSAIQVGIYYRF